MRLLHTSDWHLGRSLYREELLDAQARFLDHLVATVHEEQVDVVLVSGDVYDRALPSVDAIGLLDDGLARLASTGARTVLISGNHDSATRLGFGSRLIDAAGVHLRTDPGTVGVPVVVDDRHGDVAVYPIPYLEPATTAEHLGCSEPRHAAVVTAGMDRVRADLATRPRTRSVVLAHVFATGGAPSDSERDIGAVGGLTTVPVATFDGIDYAALGHLHGQQRLAEGVRYSGSPLPYSFSEARHRKGSWLVDLGPTGVERVEQVPAPTHRPLGTLRGRLADLLADSALADRETHYLSVTLTDPVRPADPMRRLRVRFPHTLLVTLEPDVEGTTAEESYVRRMRGRSDLEIATAFVAHVRDRAVDDWERTLLREAVRTAGRTAVDRDLAREHARDAARVGSVSA